MARKPTLSPDALEALGAAKLAALVFEEATTNAAFKRRVAAALAGQSGPEAIAKLIDRRLAGLERARAFVDWEKARAFRDDLAALLASIRNELAPADPDLGTDRLLRFVLDFLDDADDSDSPAVRQALLEADILKRLDRREEACGILWDRFRDTLAPPILRAHLRALPDFEDVAAEEKAMAVAFGHPVPLVALQFFLDWKRLDLAARVVIAHRGAWSGSDWHVLPAIAETLEAEQPLAATLLYRVLLDDILARARSKAYPHGAKYLHILDRLGPASDADPARPQDMEVHATYRAGLKANHGRKSGFWGLVEGRATREPEVTFIGRRPLWRES